MANTSLNHSQGNGNRRTYTWSGWVKRSGLGAFQCLMHTNQAGHYCYFAFNTDHTLHFYDIDGPTQQGYLYTNRKFRDTNAWMHIVLRVDTTLATANDRIRFYINGQLEDSFSARLNPSQNKDMEINTEYHTMRLGTYNNSSSFYDGYMSHVHFTDGYSYGPDTFGETDSVTGEWKIKTDVSVSYGTNGYFVFKDGNNLSGSTVQDQSGQGNNFSVIAGAILKTETSPSNVFATFNLLAKHPSCGISFANGDNKITTTTSRGSVPSTLGFNSGKYYFEFDVVTAAQDGRWEIGIQPFANVAASDATNSNNRMIGLSGYNGYVYYNGSSINNFYNTVGGFTSFTGIIGVAVDLDSSTKTIAFSRDGAWITGQNATDTNFSNALKVDITSSVADYDYWHFGVGTGNGSGTAGVGQANFGDGTFGTASVSSAGTNASSNGIFEYDCPSGYTALSTKGLNL